MGFTSFFSRKVVHVFYQLFDSKMADDGDLWSVPNLKKNIYYVEMHRQTVEKLTWLNGTYYTENQSMRFVFVTFQYYCICWMSKLLRRKYNIIKLWWRISFSQFECVFVTGLKRQDQVNLLYLMLFIIIETQIEVNCLYKARWDSYP